MSLTCLSLVSASTTYGASTNNEISLVESVVRKKIPLDLAVSSESIQIDLLANDS